MRFLLYTALAFFLALTGVLAFYALQPPVSAGGPRVVLNIEVPADDGSSNAGGFGDNRLTSANLIPTPSNSPAEAETEVKEPVASVPSETDVPPEMERAEAPDNAPSAATPRTGSQFEAVGDNTGIVMHSGGEATEDTSVGSKVAPSQAEPTEKSQVASLDRAAVAPEPDHNGGDAPMNRAENGVTNVATVEHGSEASTPPAVPESSANMQPTMPLATAEPALQPAVPPPPLPMRRPSAPPPVRVATADGWGTLTTNAATLPETAGGIRVAILLRGIGQDRRDSNEAIARLPGAVSFGVVATDDGEELAKKAREKGHEIVVQLPADLDTSSVLGFDFLSSGPSDSESRVKSVMARLKGASGVTAAAGNKVLQSKEMLQLVLTDVKARNAVFIGEGTNSHALAREMAAELKIRYGNAAVIIDTQPTPDGIKAALNRLVMVAQKRGSAIGVGYVSAETIEQIQAWAQSLTAQGVTLVPAVSLANTL